MEWQTVLWGCATNCVALLMWERTVYILRSVLVYLALSKFLQKHQLGLLQSQLLLQLLNDVHPLRWAALLQYKENNITFIICFTKDINI